MRSSLRWIAILSFVWPAMLAAGCATSEDGAVRSAPIESTDADGGIWRGLSRHEIQLGQKLLVVRGEKGVVGCPYLDVRMFERAGEACAIVPAADTHGMLTSKVVAVTTKAKELGIEVGMSGREAIERVR